VAAAARTVLPRWPGSRAAPLLPARPAVSGFLARFCGGHGLPPSAGCIGLGASPACYQCRNGSRIAWRAAPGKVLSPRGSRRADAAAASVCPGVAVHGEAGARRV